MSMSNSSKLLLAGLLLTCHFCEALRKPHTTSFTPEMIKPYVTDLDFMLKAEHGTFEDRAAKPRVQRQASEDSVPQSNSSFLFNVSKECSYGNFFLFLSELNSSCRYAVASLDTDNVTYLASQQAVRDIEAFCTDDCAGSLLEYYAHCPHLFVSLEDYVRGVCSRNNGVRCGLSLAVDDGSIVHERCFVQSSAFDRCRTRCKNALREFSNQIGCCINTYYNDTYRTVGILQSVEGLDLTASPWLWDTCGIPYPNECPSNVLSPEPTTTTAVVAASPTPVPSVCGSTEESTFRTFLSDRCTSLLTEFVKPAGPTTISNSLSSVSELCNTSCAGKYVEQCGGNDISESLVLFCGRNGDQYCGQVLADSYSNIIPHFTCGNTHNCSSECSTGLQSVSSVLGCCVHVLALADPSVAGFSWSLDGNLWSDCGLELPSQCPHPFLSDVEDGRTTGAWMAAVFISLIIILLALVAIAVVSLIFLKRRTKFNKGKMRPRTRSNVSDLDFNESYPRPDPANTRVRGETERSFEYTTTASIARHFRMDTSQHGVANGGRMTALANGELHTERNIYQSPTSHSQPEKIEMEKNEAYNLTSPNSSPIPAGANRPVSELEYHYARTDPIVIIRSGEHREGSDDNIVTELNISYAGNSEAVSDSSAQTIPAAPSMSSKVKPAVMPRRKRAGPTTRAQHARGTQDRSKEARIEMKASNPLTHSLSESSVSAQSGEAVPERSSKQTHFKNPTYLQRVNEN